MNDVEPIGSPGAARGLKHPARRRGSYGIDAPQLLPFLALLAIGNVASAVLSRTAWPLIGAAAILASAAIGLHTSRRGKFLVWSDLLDQLALEGCERILDVGCGRGAVLLLATQHLTTGRAVGVDIWDRKDQSGNSPDATLSNARLEGVADRVEVHTADMTALPFATATFDVVVSSIALHNVKRDTDRERALSETIRVLRPGGRVLIADIWGTRHYSRSLSQLGMSNVRRRRLGWRMWWSGPWLPTWLVTATTAR